jgi:putative ABC transport system ATP-binding protein
LSEQSPPEQPKPKHHKQADSVSLGQEEVEEEALKADNMIEVENVTKIYQSGNVETAALRDVSFTIADGEFVAIMGPSGSGKSTLMHILGALDSPTSGTYRLDGQDTSTLSDDELADIRSEKIGFVFQSFNLLARATVFRNVSLPLVYSGVSVELRRTRTEQSLRSAGLPEDRWLHLSNQLSGGQMQRVAIARALVNNPSLILADEPTGNLDTKTGEVVLGTFQNLNRTEHRTIILITHEPYVAEHADRIIHIRDGMILEDTKNKKKRTAHEV